MNFEEIPFKKIERVGGRGLLYHDLFCVSWLLGRYCNYSCTYCWPYASSKSNDHRKIETLMKTVDKIKEQARNRSLNSFHFSFSGGEPTLHKSFLKLIDYCAQDTRNTNYQSIHMTTNLSPGLGWLQKFAKVTEDLNRVSVTASFHHEMADQEKFAKKVAFLQSKNIHTTINLVMLPKVFDKLWGIASYFNDLDLNVTLKPQSNNNATGLVEGYTKEMLEKLQKALPQKNHIKRQEGFKRPPSRFTKWDDSKIEAKKTNKTYHIELTDNDGVAWYVDQAERLNSLSFNSFKGWECSAGYRSIIIREPDGNIKRGYSCVDSPLGNIETGFVLHDNPQKCITQNCVSSADSKIPKRKCGSNFDLWKELE